MVVASSSLQRLIDWYLRHCNGDWEHSFGFTIDTLDNPGVRIKVDLQETELSYAPFLELKDKYDSPDHWLICRRTDTIFEAFGAPTRVEDMLRIFADWADAHKTT